MGSREESTTAKPTKTTAATQELPTTPLYPDWASSMQAYYGVGVTTPPFFSSNVASSPPPPHPYMWGGQHLMPPYGTPPLPFPTIYPHGGIYAHPPLTVGAATTSIETEGKPSDGKDNGSMKKSKGISGNAGLVGGKSGGGGKATSGSGNDGASQSGESGSEASSDASDENTSQRELSTHGKRSFNQMLADAVGSSFPASGQPTASLPVPVPGKPATHLNIGMDLWSASPTGSVPVKARPDATGVPSAVAPASGAIVGREGSMPEHMWMPDERELKKQRRKQSNRESARRSRLRKQAECEELAGKVDKLNNENRTLRNELQRLAEECEKLSSENASIIKQLAHIYGQEVVSSLEVCNVSPTTLQSTDGEVNGHAHDTSRGNLGPGQKSDNFFSSNGKHESSSK